MLYFGVSSLVVAEYFDVVDEVDSVLSLPTLTGYFKSSLFIDDLPVYFGIVVVVVDVLSSLSLLTDLVYGLGYNRL